MAFIPTSHPAGVREYPGPWSVGGDPSDRIGFGNALELRNQRIEAWYRSEHVRLGLLYPEPPGAGGALAWSDEPPTEDGFYWWRASPVDVPTVIQLRENGGVYRLFVSDRGKHIANAGGQFCGPL